MKRSKFFMIRFSSFFLKSFDMPLNFCKFYSWEVFYVEKQDCEVQNEIDES
jgi:hypothetical protein